MIATKADYERVFGKQKKHPPAGRTRIGGPAVVRKADNVHFRSVALGCAVKQIPQFTRRYGDLGIRFDPTNGDAILPSRPAKLQMMKRRGMMDHDEVRGGHGGGSY